MKKRFSSYKKWPGYIMNIAKLAAVITAVIVLSFLVTYNDLSSQKERQIVNDSRIIETILVETFDEVEKVLVIIGQEISDKTPNLDLNKIYEIFRGASQLKSDVNVLPWTMFDWVDVAGYQRVNTLLGVRKDPPEIGKHRNYRNPGNELWSIILSEPAIGEPSGLYVIPVGVQIATKEHQQAGTVTSSINIQRVLTKINLRVSNDIHFALIDKRSGAVVMSSTKKDNKRGAIYINEYGLDPNDDYLVSKALGEKYPYIIKVGYNRDDFWRQIIAASIKLSFQILATFAAVLVVLYRPKS